jgi:sulfur-oxidizing protein SoxZ
VGPGGGEEPVPAVHVKGAKAGDKISVSWVDNKGDKRTDEATVS